MPRAGGGGVSAAPSAPPTPWGGGSSTPTRPRSAPVGGGGDTSPPGTLEQGSLSVDVTSPQGLAASLANDVTESGNFIEGFSKAIFGINNEGGVPVISNVAHVIGSVAEAIPLPGDLNAGRLLGGVGDTVKNAGDLAGGLAERLPSFGGAGGAANLDAQFASMPDGPEKQKALDDIAAGGAPEHVKFDAVRAYVMEQQKVNPQLFPEIAVPSGSFADDLTGLMAGLGVLSRPLERLAAGTGKLSTGLNRLQEIEAVHNGAVYTGTLGTGLNSGGMGSGNTPVEEMAYEKWHSGEWSADQALDFLSATGAGSSHDTGLEIAGTVALDPTVWGSLGAAGLAKLGATGLRLAATADGVPLRAAGAGRLNVLGKLAGRQDVSGIVRTLGEHVYTPLENSHLGTMAKVARTIVDPFHAIGGNHVVGEALTDIAAETAPKMMAEAHGISATFGVLRDARSIAPQLADDLAEDMGTYAANVQRKVLMHFHVASMMFQNLGRDLIGKNPGEILNGLLNKAPQDYAALLKDELIRVREVIWDEPARQQLGERMASMYGHKTAEEWTEFLVGKNGDYLSTLHAASYGRATKNFLGAIGQATTEVGAQAAKGLKLERLILLNKTTLTDLGAIGFLKRLDALATGSPADRAAVMLEAQAKYPELRYIPYDPANAVRSVDRWAEWLQHHLDDGRLPSQLTDAEMKGMPEALQAFNDNIRRSWTLGFRPEDDKLMGLAYDGEGRLVPGFEPWVDHVAQSTPSYRGSFAMEHNVAGMPILGTKVGKLMDYMEAGARTMFARVSTEAVHGAATQRFTALAADRFGLTPEKARDIIRAVQEEAGAHEIAVRGLSAKNMWAVTKPLVYGTKMTQRDMLNLVVDAYEGDLRFVGLTQKFTGRAKSAFAHATQSNMAGQLAEDLYQKIRFKYNFIFQGQERIEPFVLSAQRGVNFAFGTKLNDTDRAAAAIYKQMYETGIERASDVDQAENSARALVGSTSEETLGRAVPQGIWDQLRDVSGVKVLNQLRTFEKNIGRNMKTSWETNAPGEWGRLVTHYSDQAGHLVSDDEVAVRMLTEGALAGDIKVASVIPPGANLSTFTRSASTADWHPPANFGELKGLDLDGMASNLQIPLKDGTTLHDAAGIRRALADHTSGFTMDDLTDALIGHGAHEDYVRRVQNALNFHYDGFWRTVKEQFNMTSAEVAAHQDMFAGAAAIRNMTPVDYLSQVFSPMIGGGTEAAIKAMEDSVSILRAVKKGGKFISTDEDFLTQVAQVFHHHLDPSGQDTLLAAFGKDAGWTPEVSRNFAKVVKDYLAGVTPNDPDIERAIEQFGKWSKAALKDGLLKNDPQFEDLLSKVVGIPTDNAVPYNQMHQLMANQVGHALRLASNDAFRLQYFSKNRTFLERSVNHPFFGIYPASYMFGKILPELARFMAHSPFGIRTGGALYAATDVSKAIAIQREFDPDFAKTMDELGHSSTGWFLSYLLPAIPWDIGSAYPTWARDLAQQGLDNQARVDAGQEPRDIDLTSPIGRIADYVTPFRQVKQVTRPLDEIGEMLPDEQEQAPTATPGAPSTAGGIQASGLAPVLENQMNLLQDVLAGG